MPVLVAPPELHDRLDEAIDPIFDLMWTASTEVANLVGLRDLLLPKLVSGQIDLSTLDLDAFAASVA